MVSFSSGSRLTAVQPVSSCELFQSNPSAIRHPAGEPARTDAHSLPSESSQSRSPPRLARTGLPEVGKILRGDRAKRGPLHMPQLPKRLHATPLILRPPGTFSDRRRPQLRDDLRNGGGTGGHCARARHAPEAAITGPVAPVEVQLRHGNPFQFQVLPNIEFGLFQKANCGARPPIASRPTQHLIVLV